MSIAYRVTEVLAPEDLAVGSREFPLPRPVIPQWVKDYDAEEGNSPLDWPSRFDVRSWCFLAAYSGRARVGGAVVVTSESEMDTMEGRDDLAVLWDLRITPSFRGCGVGSRLLAAAETWARARGAHSLKVETQNINVPACRFYAHRGFVLGAVNEGAYESFPDEIQLFWYKELRAAPGTHDRTA